MSIIEPELTALKDNLLDMLNLVINQISTCKEAIHKIDVKLAEEVIENEKKVNSQELAIDRDCENVLALHTPVAVDLRFVLSALRISNDLERIGDNTNSLARFIKHNSKEINKKLLEEFRLEKMLEILSSMLQDMRHALKSDDTNLAKETLKKDLLLNEINKKALKTAEAILKDQSTNAKVVLRLFSIVRNLERSGDLTKNIGEEIVFHVEAEVLKHRKDK
jgi:phosphate transport system protein